MTELPHPPKDGKPGLMSLARDRDGRLFLAFLLWVVFAAAYSFFEKANQPILSGLALFISALVILYIGLSRLIAPRPSRWVWPNNRLLTRLSGVLFIGFSLMVGWSAIQRLLTSFQ